MSQAISRTGCRQELVIGAALLRKAHSSIGRCNMYIDIGNAAGKQSMLQPATVTKRLLRESRGERSQPRQGQRSRPAGVEVGWHKHQLGKTLEGKCFWHWALRGGRNLESWRPAQLRVSC